jgi:hypothetical protein
MPLFVHAVAAWARRHVAWPTGRQARVEAAGVAFLAAAMAACAWWGLRLSWSQRAALGGLLLLTVAVLLRRGWLRLFGPVFDYDLVRTARRRQFITLRWVYGGCLVATVFLVYAAWALRQSDSFAQLFSRPALESRALADFAAAFLYAFLSVQLLAAWLLTPAYTAPALTEDKRSGALEFLLATDLRGREVVLGLAASRLANLALVILTGLPVLSLMELLGGIDPQLVLAGFAVTGVTMASLTCLGALVAVYAPEPRHAVLRTYALAAVFLIVSGASWLLLHPWLGWAGYPSTESWTSPVVLEDVVRWLNLGNPVSLAFHLAAQVGAGMSLDQVLPGAVARYALFHGVVGLVLLIWAVARLRAVALRRGAAAPPRLALPGTTRRWRPGVGRWPFVWKEVFAAPGGRLRWLGRIAWGVLVPVSFLPALGFWYYHHIQTATPYQEYSEDMSAWLRLTGTLVAGVTLVGVALRAAGSVQGERDGGTLDSLLTTPSGTRGLLAAKWLGSILGARWGCAWLGIVWAVGVAAGVLDTRVVPALVGAWLIYAAFLASLGLWFSVHSRTAQRALLGTLLAAAGFGAGHWLVWVVLLPFASWWHGSRLSLPGLTELQLLGLTPPITLILLASPPPEGGGWNAADWQWAMVPMLRGAVIWLLGAAAFWILASGRFRALYGDIRRPRHSVAPPVHEQRRPLLAPGSLGLVAVMALVAFVAGWFFVHFDPTSRRLAEALAEADRLDPGWRLEELEAKRRVVPDDQNSGLQVPLVPDERLGLRAPRWYPGKRWPSADTEELLKDLPPQLRLTPAQYRALKKDMDAIRPVIMQARRLMDYPFGRYPVEYRKDPLSTLLPYAQRNRQIANVLSYDALCRAADGDLDGAVASVRAGINCSRSIGDEPFFISLLVRSACRYYAVIRIERILGQGQPAEQALAALQHSLESDEKEPLFLVAARGERAMLDQFMQAISSGDVPSDRILRYPAYYDVNLSWPDRLLLASGVSVPGERAALLAFLDEAVEISKFPLEEQQGLIEQLSARAAGLPVVAHSLVCPRQPFLVLKRLAELHRRNRTFMRCALALVAVERHRQKHDRWPASLDELIPDFLSQIPLDPYDGKPLRYRRLVDGVMIYSLGPDGRDYGGPLIREYGFPRESPEVVYKNFGFRLWDVGLRRQPAPVSARAPTKP